MRNIKQYKHDWYLANRQVIRQRHHDWYQAHRAECLEYQRKYSRKKYQELRQALFEKYGTKCNYCGSIKNLELDHVYDDALPARSKGDPSRNGRARTEMEWKEALTDMTGRFQILCHKCNLEKERRRKIKV